MLTLKPTQTEAQLVFVSVTRLRVRSLLYLPAFLWNVGLTVRQIVNTPGFLGGQLLRDANQTYWTLTAWEAQAAMKIYRNSGAHRNVMPHIQDWCDEASIAHWQQQDSNFPSWAEIHHRLVTTGYLTKLSKPSLAHLERRIPEPQSSQVALLRPRKKYSAAVRG